mmetsp:Transcript_129461/g.242197  ORF Transcript_129461/g.242197 Transcript_129461/m.242197 type:complete len:158 (+) Transcript_129461:49-522(+)
MQRLTWTETAGPRLAWSEAGGARSAWSDFGDSLSKTQAVYPWVPPDGERGMPAIVKSRPLGSTWPLKTDFTLESSRGKLSRFSSQHKRAHWANAGAPPREDHCRWPLREAEDAFLLKTKKTKERWAITPHHRLPWHLRADPLHISGELRQGKLPIDF